MTQSLLADHTNGRVYATVLRPSVVCNVCIAAKRFVLPQNCLKEIGNSP